jgi:hypothetical protein
VAFPANARHRIIDVSESRGSCGLHILVRNGLSQLSSSNTNAW